MTELEHKILVHLRNHHRGSGNAITFKTLSVELQINSRELRYCVSNIVTNGEGCIGTDSISGYYWLTSEEEFEHNQNELRSRAMKILVRRKGQRIAWKNRSVKVEQQSLFLERV